MKNNKNEWRDSEGLVGHYQIEQHAYYRSSKKKWKEKGAETLCERIIAKNFSILRKKMNI